MDDLVLIGVDGGATKVLVHTVEILTNPLRFGVKKPLIEVSYESSPQYQPKFKPRALSTQLREHKANKVKPGPEEKQQELAILDSFTKAICSLTTPNDNREFVIGVGLPGLKTPKKRGISAMANGPRMPQFLNNLEKRLKAAGFDNLHPIHAIGSDADYCGLGEHWGDAGAMRDIASAYYIGIGTGVADALLLQDKMVAFDDIKPWMAKTWEMMFSETESYENMVSAQGIQRRYAALTDTTLEDLNAAHVYPWQIFERALDGEETAVQIAGETCEALAELLYQRIRTLAVGNPDTILVDAKRKLTAEHEYLGLVFERIVIGQRLGDIWQFEDFKPVFREVIEDRLGRRLFESDLSPEIKMAYLTNTNRLRDDLIIASRLRHAPALGAAVDAYLHWIG